MVVMFFVSEGTQRLFGFFPSRARLLSPEVVPSSLFRLAIGTGTHLDVQLLKFSSRSQRSRFPWGIPICPVLICLSLEDSLTTLG